MVFVAGLALAASTLQLQPTDDVWVYPHAGDPSKDAYLRVWGSGGRAVAQDAVDTTDFGYSYLRFKVPADLKSLKGAKLTLTHIAGPGYDKDFSKAFPIQVHGLKGTFEEKAWSYDLINKVQPIGEKIFGTGWAENLSADKPFQIVIDLGKPEFYEYISAASKSGGDLYLALCTKVDVAEVGMKSMYKVFSKDAETDANKPKLVLETE